jgi:hypothetical protein
MVDHTSLITTMIAVVIALDQLAPTQLKHSLLTAHALAQIQAFATMETEELSQKNVPAIVTLVLHLKSQVELTVDVHAPLTIVELEQSTIQILAHAIAQLPLAQFSIKLEVQPVDVCAI